MKRVLCLYLPFLSTDRLRRRDSVATCDPSTPSGGGASGVPVATVEPHGQVIRIAHVNRAAGDMRIRAGQTLAEAKAIAEAAAAKAAGDTEQVPDAEVDDTGEVESATETADDTEEVEAATETADEDVVEVEDTTEEVVETGDESEPPGEAAETPSDDKQGDAPTDEGSVD